MKGDDIFLFQTIREVARTGLAPEAFIRRLVAQGKCPGVYSGTRFLVNVELLTEYLMDASRTTAKGGEAE